jgi:hypothetical protein
MYQRKEPQKFRQEINRIWTSSGPSSQVVTSISIIPFTYTQIHMRKWPDFGEDQEQKSLYPMEKSKYKGKGKIVSVL